MAAQVNNVEPLPESGRVVYEKNPLVQVLLQLRFPALLKIASEPPSAFQDKIRSEYPVLTELQPNVLGLPVGLPSSLAQAVQATLPVNIAVGYEFGSADGVWKVNLSRDFLSLSTSEYRRWEEFRGHLQTPMAALQGLYSPSFFTRIGLRYQDLIERSSLGLSDVQWSDLLQPHICGPLAVANVAPAVEATYGQTLIRFPEFSGRVRMNFGIVQKPNSSEDCFLIDSDFFTDERIDIAHVSRILDYFNKQSGKLFRWCIKDRLHDALQPTAVVSA